MTPAIFYSPRIKHTFNTKELNESRNFLTAIFQSNLRRHKPSIITFYFSSRLFYIKNIQKY